MLVKEILFSLATEKSPRASDAQLETQWIMDLSLYHSPHNAY